MAAGVSDRLWSLEELVAGPLYYIGWVMNEIRHDQLKFAIESQHGGTATFVQAVPVKETFEGATVW